MDIREPAPEDPPGKRDTYHHGNLRAALLDAGLELLAEQGVDAVTLREVAKRAHVSHNAPYHHFSGKSALLAGVAARGFERVVAAIQAAVSAVDPHDPRAAFLALGRSYVQFAVANPSVFRLMFRPELTRPQDHPELVAAESRAFGSLMEIIGLCQQHQCLPAGDPFAMAACAWSTVHGLATLQVERLLQETPLGAYDWPSLVEVVDQFIVRGLRDFGH